MQLLVFSALAVVAKGHAAITLPAMRQNPTVAGGDCPWCQGAQDGGVLVPPSPCWGATPGESVLPRRFGGWKDKLAPDGTPWIDQQGGTDHVPVWCPGSSVQIRTRTAADHNGVVRWESQRAVPGQETEQGFRNFTEWRCFNNDPDIKYYADDGVTPLAPGKCTRDNLEWSPYVADCRPNTWAEMSLHIPADMEPGQTVVRWFWYGAMLLDETRVAGPEQSIFLNCGDIIVGTPEQCGGPPPPTPVPTPVPTPSGCPGGSLDACIDLCPAATFTACVKSCQKLCEGSVAV